MLTIDYRNVQGAKCTDDNGELTAVTKAIAFNMVITGIPVLTDATLRDLNERIEFAHALNAAVEITTVVELDDGAEVTRKHLPSVQALRAHAGLRVNCTPETPAAFRRRLSTNVWADTAARARRREAAERSATWGTAQARTSEVARG